MRNKLYMLIFIFGLMFIMPNVVKANENMELSLNCTSTTDQTDNISCDIIADTNDKKIEEISFRYTIDSSIKYSNFNTNVGSANINGSTIKITGAGLTGNNVKIGTLKFRSVNGTSGNKTIRVQSINYTDSDGTYYSHPQINSSVYISLSNKKEITSLNISSGTLNPVFKKNIYNYTVSNYKEDTINISAEHNGSSITGVGTHDLSLGDNVIKLVVTAQDGSTKTYKITVNRVDTRSSDANLSNIKLSTGNLDFKANKKEYNVNVSASKVTIETEKNSSNQKVEFDPSDKISLDVEEEKTVSIKVSAENGATNTYKIHFKRVESSDDSLGFKSFKINGNDFEFEDDKTSYNLSVSNSVTELKFDYELNDEDSNVEIVGDKDLQEGNNEVILTIKNKKNEEKKYTFWVDRKPDIDVLENDKDQIIIELEGNKDEIYVGLKEDDENKTIYKEVLNKLAKTDKKLIYQVLNKNEGIIYSIELKNIEDINYEEDIDISMDLIYTNGDIKSLVNKSDFIYIKSNCKKLPLGAKITIFVGDVFDNNTKLYLYKYDNKALENLNISGNVKKGYITFDAEDLSSIVISDFDITNKAKKTDKIENKVSNKPNKMFVTVSLIVEFIVIIGLVICAVINNKKLKYKKFENLDI